MSSHPQGGPPGSGAFRTLFQERGPSAQAQGSFGEGQLGPALTPAVQPGAGLSLSPSELGAEGERLKAPPFYSHTSPVP